ncbi:hypothetical protein [Nonomuraea sp. NPDC050310]|uniref:hypothetical protein n=1 Tax=Nonomuraea sp. NPDC050310 TaxID=3154935 RepID=UPI0033EB0CF0
MTDLTPYMPPPWAAWAAAGILVLAAVLTAVRWARRRPATDKPATSTEDRLTRVVAGIATAVSAEGMWRFSGDVLELDGPLRVMLFAFIELAIVVSAIRARRNMRDNYSAGIDGIAVWVLAALTAVLSTLDAKSFGEGVFRLVAPLVAAWLWERGMAIERRRLRGTSTINWRLTPERILVRLRLAEPSERTAGEVDAQRRINRASMAKAKLDDLRAVNASPRRQRAGMRKFRRALAAAVEHSQLAVNEERQQMLLAQIDAMQSAEVLADRKATAGWVSSPPPAGAGAVPEEARLAMEAGRAWEANGAVQRALDLTATSILAREPWLTGRPGATSPATTNHIADLVASEVTGHPLGEAPVRLHAEIEPDDDTAADATSTATGDATPSATAAMYEYFLKIVQVEKRIPSGAELARIGACSETYGRKKRAEWEAQVDGRVRRGLAAGPRREKAS